MLDKVKSLWNKAQEVVIDFIRATLDDFVTVWEFRPNVLIWMALFAVLCLVIV
jgi:hypothetical protein